MLSAEDLDKIKETFAQLGILCDADSNEAKNKGLNKKKADKCNERLKLNPTELLVIAGLLCGVLEATSILVDRDQRVDIVVSGSLKRKTQLEKVMEQIGKLPFDQVMQAMLNSMD